MNTMRFFQFQFLIHVVCFLMSWTDANQQTNDVRQVRFQMKRLQASLGAQIDFLQNEILTLSNAVGELRTLMNDNEVPSNNDTVTRSFQTALNTLQDALQTETEERKALVKKHQRIDTMLLKALQDIKIIIAGLKNGIKNERSVIERLEANQYNLNASFQETKTDCNNIISDQQSSLKSLQVDQANLATTVVQLTSTMKETVQLLRNQTKPDLHSRVLGLQSTVKSLQVDQRNLSETVEQLTSTVSETESLMRTQQILPQIVEGINETLVQIKYRLQTSEESNLRLRSTIQRSITEKLEMDRENQNAILQDSIDDILDLKSSVESLQVGQTDLSDNVEQLTSTMKATVFLLRNQSSLPQTVHNINEKQQQMESRLQASENNIRQLSSTVERLASLVEDRRTTAKATGRVNGGPCNDDYDCETSYSECREGKCGCVAGLSYSRKRDTCVTSCDAYGSTFQKIEGHYINSNNKQIIRVRNAEECKRRCIEERTYICRSFDLTRNNLCFLQSVTKRDVHERLWNADASLLHYQRDCLQ